MEKIYLSGKISGRNIGEAKHHFLTHQLLLGLKGYDVVNPFDLHKDYNKSWEEFMKVDIKALCDCDSIVMLNGWTDSKGALLENHIAHSLGLKIYAEDNQMNIIGIYED
jgi:hypothetical protein